MTSNPVGASHRLARPRPYPNPNNLETRRGKPRLAPSVSSIFPRCPRRQKCRQLPLWDSEPVHCGFDRQRKQERLCESPTTSPAPIPTKPVGGEPWLARPRPYPNPNNLESCRGEPSARPPTPHIPTPITSKPVAASLGLIPLCALDLTRCTRWQKCRNPHKCKVPTRRDAPPPSFCGRRPGGRGYRLAT